MSRAHPVIILLLGGCSLAAALLSPCPAAAQVNTESLRPGAPQEGLLGDLSTDLALKGGNADFFRVAGTARLAYQRGIHTPLLYTRSEFGNAGGEDFAENAFVHARWTAMWFPRVGSELFGQLQYDRFVRMNFRALLGGGPRFVVLQGDAVQLYLGTGYMLEREVLDIPEDDPHPRLTLYHRSTSYLSLKVALSDSLLLTNVGYVQPRFDRPSDVRVLDDLELQVAVDDHFKLVQSLVFAYDSDPPSVVRARYDIMLTAGLRLAL